MDAHIPFLSLLNVHEAYFVFLESTTSIIRIVLVHMKPKAVRDLDALIVRDTAKAVLFFDEFKTAGMHVWASAEV